MGFLDRFRRSAEVPPFTPPMANSASLTRAVPAPAPWEAVRHNDATLPWGSQVSVVGESYYQESFLSICGPKSADGYLLDVVAELRPEPDNEYDSYAVAVFVHGLKVGHLSRQDNRTLRASIDDAIATHGVASCHAFVRGGWDRGGGDTGHFGITLRFSNRTWTFAPPSADELRLPTGGAVSVSNEELYQAALRDATKGRDVTTTSCPVLAEVVIAEANPSAGPSSTGPVLEIRLDGRTVGFLTPAMTAKFLPIAGPALSAGKRVTVEASLFAGVKKGQELIEIRLHATSL